MDIHRYQEAKSRRNQDGLSDKDPVDLKTEGKSVVCQFSRRSGGGHGLPEGRNRRVGNRIRQILENDTEGSTKKEEETVEVFG